MSVNHNSICSSSINSTRGSRDCSSLYDIPSPQNVTCSLIGNSSFFPPKYAPAKHMYMGTDAFIGKYTGTDSSLIFLFKEQIPPTFLNDLSKGRLDWLRFSYMRSFFLLVYVSMAFLKYILYYLNVPPFLHQWWWARGRPSRGRFRKVRQYIVKHSCSSSIIRKARVFSARKIRKYLARAQHICRMYIAASALLLLLILCGDIHPQPGPTFPGSTRHPTRQLLVVGSWNVRTLLETKRTPVRPSAIVARELDRYGIDIAALAETRYLGEKTF